MEIEQLDEAGIKLLIQFEGLVLHPYKDNAGIPTIGIGMTYYPETGKKVTMQDAPLPNDAEAYRQFLLMSRPYELAVYSTTRDDLTQNQFNALVCLTYNIGTGGFKGSTVHRLVNASVIGLPLQEAWLAWSHDGGKVDPGLLNRRKLELATYLS